MKRIIHVDPRFTRTSAMADLQLPIRAGIDIAFLGGIIHSILENDRAFREYVVHYANAPVIIESNYRGPEELEGFFSGWNAEKGDDDDASWQYQGVEPAPPAG